MKERKEGGKEGSKEGKKEGRKEGSYKSQQNIEHQCKTSLLLHIPPSTLVFLNPLRLQFQ
jgi:hypothetical protein